jgi:hypothetical protein
MLSSPDLGNHDEWGGRRAYIAMVIRGWSNGGSINSLVGAMGPQEMNETLPRHRGRLASLSLTVPRRGFIYMFQCLTRTFDLSCLPLASAVSCRLNEPDVLRIGNGVCTQVPISRILVDGKVPDPS